MNRRRPPGIWVTNQLANPLLRPLLHRPAGHLLGRYLALEPFPASRPCARIAGRDRADHVER